MDLPIRKNNRLKDYDYSQNGAYFVTICTHNHRNIFWENTDVSVDLSLNSNPTNVGADLRDHPNTYQKINVGAGLRARPQNSNQNNVEAGLCARLQPELSQIGNEIKKSIQFIEENYDYISIDKYVIMPNHVHLIIIFKNTGGHGNPPLQDIVGRFKSFTTNKYGNLLWQRSFHDHIIRNEQDYKKIWEYIDNNPMKLELDKYYKCDNSDQ